MIQMNYIYGPRSLQHLVLFDLIDVHTICKITCQILTISYQFRIFTSLLIQAVVIVESPAAEKARIHSICAVQWDIVAQGLMLLRMCEITNWRLLNMTGGRSCSYMLNFWCNSYKMSFQNFCIVLCKLDLFTLVIRGFVMECECFQFPFCRLQAYPR